MFDFIYFLRLINNRKLKRGSLLRRLTKPKPQPKSNKLIEVKEEIKITSGIKYIEITQEWKDSANEKEGQPTQIIIHNVGDTIEYKGNRYMIDGIKGKKNRNVWNDFDNKELSFGKWLSTTFNENVEMMPVINGKYPGVKTPDYIFKNEHWDLKRIRSCNHHKLFKNIVHKEGQATGFMFDLTKSTMKETNYNKSIYKIFTDPRTNWLDKIMIKKGNTYKVYKRI